MQVIYFAFLVLEVAIGIYFPSISTLKSTYIPEANRANIMNWFRVPMNVITCVALLTLKMPLVSQNKGFVFLFCLAMAVVGLVVVKKFNQANVERAMSNNEQEDKEKLLNAAV